MIRRAMEMEEWCLGVVLGCVGDTVECIGTGIEARLGIGHDR